MMAWDIAWAATKPSEAMRYLADNYPEASGSAALHGHRDAAHAAAVAGDDRILEALRSYMRPGRDETMRMRRGAA